MDVYTKMAKVASYFLAFTLAFLAATSLSGVFLNDMRNTDPEIRIKVYEFLLEDSKNMQALYDKLDNRKDHSGAFFVKTLEERSDEVAHSDISRLPENFQLAWIKYVSVNREWTDFLGSLKHLPETMEMDEAEIERADEIIAKQSKAWDDLKRAADQYGVELNDFGAVTVK